MQKVETVKFMSDDGTIFTDAEDCREYEQKQADFTAMIKGKIGDFTIEDLRLGGQHGDAVVDELPFTAPWLSPFGACLINVTDVRRNSNGKVEFQLADGHNKPYEDGTEWRPSEAFYSEWPQ